MKLYNSLTRKKEEFIPVTEGHVNMYNCGPTVYNYIHVGNARPLVVFDTLRRFFIYKGYNVKFVVNFTDIDDRMIDKANDEGTTVQKIAERYIEAFMEDAKGLNLYDYETINPRATQFISQIVEFIEGLIEKGAAYNVDGNVYFNISSAKDYGKLSKKKLEDLISGARVDINEEKRNPMDFALWKKEKEGEPSWDSPWGKGRPGWHIECSVMAKTLLGETIDIHSGGEDLQFPHHENEIAQSETLNNKPFANYWLHNGMITVDNQKMSKSLGNFFTIKDVGKEYDLEVLRFFLLSAHYRSPMNFSREVMNQTQNALERLYNSKKNLEYLMDKVENREIDEDEKPLVDEINNYKDKFIESMEDDINTADAIAYLFEMVKLYNTHINEDSSKDFVKYAYNTMMDLAKILGILTRRDEILESEILELIEKRTEARKNKNYKLSDEIRDILKEKGIILEDTKDGVKWKRV
ncbi:cysteine--tRNA ligase [Paratissierella segnis]|uniref:Cysteine--tRNA ligase n=1 Tax=Paratissierella segnis TaxID=2763679 RepID=A0A926ESG7_9FIRM|nr:cysteine--tRNA ligase [Paratissierella segnis]MBC8588041.1 cysteine--tRNA ligase [Paratissierella segnis]